MNEFVHMGGFNVNELCTWVASLCRLPNLPHFTLEVTIVGYLIYPSFTLGVSPINRSLLIVFGIISQHNPIHSYKFHLSQEERQALVSSPRRSTVVFRRLVVLAVVSWDEDVGSTYNTHGRRRIFVKESVVTHDSAVSNLLFVSLFRFYYFRFM